jgi:hypothetical protein
MAYGMVTIYGMNKRIGNISFYDSKSSEYSFNKPYSESTAQTIDEEVRLIVEIAYKRTRDLLIDKRNELEILAKELLDKEILFQNDLTRLIGVRPFDQETTYEAFTNSTDKPSTPPALGIEHSAAVVADVLNGIPLANDELAQEPIPVEADANSQPLLPGIAAPTTQPTTAQPAKPKAAKPVDDAVDDAVDTDIDTRPKWLRDHDNQTV